MKYSYLVRIILQQIYLTHGGALGGICAPIQGGRGSNDSGVLNTLKSSIIRALLPDSVLCHIHDTYSQWVGGLIHSSKYSQHILCPQDRIRRFREYT